MADLVAGCARGSLTVAERRRILERAGVSRDPNYRKAELDLVISFLQGAVESGSFDVEHQQAFAQLKELFEVQEGEFLRYRTVEVATLLHSQLEQILADEVIDPQEDEY